MAIEFSEESNNSNFFKEKGKFFIIFLFIVILTTGSIFIYFKYVKKAPAPPEEKPKERTMEDVLDSLTAPGGGGAIQEGILKTISAPVSVKSGTTEVPKKIMDSLTAPK